MSLAVHTCVGELDAGELRMGGAGVGEQRLDLGDEHLGEVGTADGRADVASHLLPRGTERRMVCRLGDRRGDLREGLVVALLERDVLPDDQVGVERRDLLEVEVPAREHDRFQIA